MLTVCSRPRLHAPSDSQQNVNAFYTNIKRKWARCHNLIIGGDWNDVEEPSRGRHRIWENADPHQNEQYQAHKEFDTFHNLYDTALNNIDEDQEDIPHMTNRSKHSKGITLSRIDRIYVNGDLEGQTFNLNHENNPENPYSTPPITTTHYPVVIQVHNLNDLPQIKQYKHIFRAKRAFFFN